LTIGQIIFWNIDLLAAVRPGMMQALKKSSTVDLGERQTIVSGTPYKVLERKALQVLDMLLFRAVFLRYQTSLAKISWALALMLCNFDSV
jgi:hypothetical protein